jgi:proteasome beta subunit
MTVVLSLVCADGLVVAGDRQITDRYRGLSYPAQKVHPLGDGAAWGGCGARAVLLELEQVFDRDAGAILESADVGRAIQARVIPVLRHHYEHFIEVVPGEKTEGTPSAYILAAGYRDSEPWIVEINPNGMATYYDDVGFHAIGSGAAMAQQASALLAHTRMRERSTSYGVVAAVRVLEALTVSSPSVGGPFDVCRVDADGRHLLDDGELEAASKLVERWRQLDQRVLDDLFDS